MKRLTSVGEQGKSVSNLWEILGIFHISNIRQTSGVEGGQHLISLVWLEELLCDVI